MNKIIIFFLLLSSVAFAQFKKEIEEAPSIKNSIVTDNPSGFLLDYLASDNFQMHHTMSMSYTASSGAGVALGVYTNSMALKISDKIDANVDVSFVNSPYSSFGQEHQKMINGIYLSRAQINYRPTDNMALTVGFNQYPGGMYSPYRYGRFGYSPFNNFWDD